VHFAKILITKVSIVLSNIIYKYIVRIKCNRCGRGNSNLFIQQNSCLNANNSIISPESIAKGDMPNNNSYLNRPNYSFSPKHNNNLYYKDNKGNKKFNKCKKPFVERPGDWICSNCQNLNFAFRNNCNRCHLSRNESQNILDKNGKQ
jgi:hypothetical protein